MSLIPFLNELLTDQSRPRYIDLYDQNFGLGLCNNEAITPTASLLLAPLSRGYMRPWRNCSVSDSGISSIQSDKDELRINLDVQQFKPEELKVKVDNGYLVVDGQHEERSDEHGYISRQFTRRYKIPEDVDESTLASSLSSDGVLALKAKKKTVPGAVGKEIPIIRTNKPAVKNTDPKYTEKMEQ